MKGFYISMNNVQPRRYEQGGENASNTETLVIDETIPDRMPIDSGDVIREKKAVSARRITEDHPKLIHVKSVYSCEFLEETEHRPKSKLFTFKE